MKLPHLRALFLLTFAIGLSHALPAQQTSTIPSDPAQTIAAPSPTQAQPAQNPPAQIQPQPPASQPVKDANGVYTIHRNARLVVLDMVITDAKGNIVPDLKREDFHVTEAEQPQTILNFTPAGAHALDPQVTIDSTEELDHMQAEADDILRDTLHCFEDGAIEEGALTAFNIVLEQFHHAVADRKALLMSMPQNLQRASAQFRATGTL